MKKETAKLLGLALAGSMLVSMAAPGADAATKMTISKKKITIAAGEKATIKVKKTKKKVKWSVTSGKKVVKLTKKKKTSVVVVAKKTGKAVVAAKLGKKMVTCKVTVTAAKKEAEATLAPETTAAPTQVPATTVPTVVPTASAAPTATVAPTSTPTATPSAVPQETAASEPTKDPTQYEGLDTSWIDPAKPMVAFTFDDGPVGLKETATTSMQIQDALTEAGAHATFFYIGSRIDDAGRKEVESALTRGFEIGNHSYGWKSLANMDPDEIAESVDDTNAVLTEISGYKNILFRAPNLDISEDMKATIKAPFINCSIDSKDWEKKTTTEQIIKNVEAAEDGDIVLMHATEKNTVEALPTLLQYFKEKGYQIVSVSELFAVKGIKLEAGKTYSSAK